MSHFEVRYIHKISPRHTDVSYIESAEIDACFSGDSKALAAALRKAGVLEKGQRLHSSRFDAASGNLVAFPANHNGLTCYPHSLLIRKIDEADLYSVHVGVGPSVGRQEWEAYGYARSHSLYEFMFRNHRPLAPESAPRTYTYLVCDRGRPERWVEAGGFFIEAGKEF